MLFSPFFWPFFIFFYAPLFFPFSLHHIWYIFTFYLHYHFSLHPLNPTTLLFIIIYNVLHCFLMVELLKYFYIQSFSHPYGQFPLHKEAFYTTRLLNFIIRKHFCVDTFYGQIFNWLNINGKIKIRRVQTIKSKRSDLIILI